VRRALDWFANTSLWLGICWGLAGVELLDGTAYIGLGNSAATVPGPHGTRLTLPAFYLLAHSPGGIRGYGVLVTLLAGLLIYASAVRGTFARRVLQCHFIAFLWMDAAAVAGWFLTNQFAPGIFTKWALIAWLTLLLSVRIPRRERHW
jgi:hypothetical protein